jgi:glycosyltransferase involved in cell wall biosynthesis
MELVTASRPLKVVIYKDRYQSTFMSPRASRHQVKPTLFVPFNRIRSNWDGFTVLPPVPGAGLVHAHNRIPLAAKRFICSFENALPRAFGFSDSSLLRAAMQAALESKRCRRLVAMSHAAKRYFQARQPDPAVRARLEAKLMVRHPNVHMGAPEDALAGDAAEHLHVTFVGGHFGRKGGAACVRAAEIALARRLPVTFHIISSLQVGQSTWLDPTLPDFFEPYLSKLSLPNIHFLAGLPNAEVRALLGRSHFLLLPTLADTFGFSMIEAMAEHTPVMASQLSAAPEIVAEGANGYLLDLPADPSGDWAYTNYGLRHTQEYADRFREANESLAQQLIDRLEPLIAQREANARLRHNAYVTASRMFSARSQGALWDALYERVAAEDLREEPALDPVHDISSPADPHAFLQAHLA